MSDIIEADPRTGIGGNSPPRPLSPDEVRSYLGDQHTALILRRNELANGIVSFCANNQTIEDDETQGRAAENLSLAQRYLSKAEATRKADKEPFLEGGRAVDGWFKALVKPLDDALLPLKLRMREFADREEEIRRTAAAHAARIARLEAERAAAEAAAAMTQDALDAAARAAEQAEAKAAIADARPSSFTQARGEFGAVASVSETWAFEVIDPMALVLAVARGEAPLACLSASQSGIRAHLATLPDVGDGATRTKTLPGVRVWVERQIRSRR